MLFVGDIMKHVAAHYQVSFADLAGSCRKRRYARPRQVTMYLARHLTGQSLPRIARRFNCDHTAIHYARLRIEELMQTNPHFAAEVAALRDALTKEKVQ